MDKEEAKSSAEDYQRAVLEARGTDPYTAEKIQWLNAKWKSEIYGSSGEEADMMHSILFSQPSLYTPLWWQTIYLILRQIMNTARKRQIYF